MEKHDNIKMKLLAWIIVLLVLIIGVNILKNVGKNNYVYDYNNEGYLEQLLKQGTIVKDRETYYILEEIIGNYIVSYQCAIESFCDDVMYDESNYKDYYDILDVKYKKKLSKKEYLNLADEFLEKFYIKSVETGKHEIIKQGMISDIYKINGYDNTYFCVLHNDEMQDIAYIGISLNTYEKSYTIFYMK